MTQPAHEPLTDEEWQWIFDRLGEAAEIGMDVADVVSIEARYDEVVHAIERGEAPEGTAEELIDVAGIALGEHLRQATGTRWAIFVDGDGSGLCLWEGPPEHRTLFPQATVANRVQRRETGWIRAFAAATAQRLGEGRGPGEAHG